MRGKWEETILFPLFGNCVSLRILDVCVHELRRYRCMIDGGSVGFYFVAGFWDNTKGSFMVYLLLHIYEMKTLISALP